MFTTVFFDFLKLIYPLHQNLKCKQHTLQAQYFFLCKLSSSRLCTVTPMDDEKLFSIRSTLSHYMTGILSI